jgi:hypothetical protein
MKITLNYSDVESEEINPFHLAENPSDYLIFEIRKGFICTKCEKPLTWYKSKRCITLRCGCGCRIFYPKNEKGLKLSTFISKEEYEKRGNE